MGGGGGTKSSSTSYSGSAQKWAKPIAQAATGDVNSVYRASQPGLNNLTQMTQNDLVPSLVNQYKGGIGASNQAVDYYSDVLGGKYLDGNPQMQGMLDMTNRDIGNNVNASMAHAGRYGSGVHNDVLARAIADNETTMRYKNYGDEMTRMGQAAQGAQTSNMQAVAEALAGIGTGAELPYTGTNALANQLGALFNGGTTKSTQETKGPGLLGSLIGAAGSAGAAYLGRPGG